MPSTPFTGPLEPAGTCRWRIPKSYKAGMRVDGMIYADDVLIEQIRADQACEQVANVATLPGIQVASLAMPDIHWGYGFCIGGVCATDPEEGGVISPGGVGYDINCGVRVVRSNLQLVEVQPHLEELVGELFANIPTGVGRGGKYKFNRKELRNLMGTGPAGLLKRDLATEQDLDMHLVYDVAHNIAKFEQHDVEGIRKRVWVHRKGATRAFPPGHPEVPKPYQEVGQPVLIPGDMGRASWILAGQPGSMEQTFGTACHGAGRMLSRTAAVRASQGRRIDRELLEKGIVAKARSWKGLAEEQPAAYKDVDLVVEVVQRAGLAKKVARMRPIGVIKG